MQDPTITKTMPNIIPYSIFDDIFEIKLKLVEPENPYISEQPYNKSPEDNALNTKYFKPDSDEKHYLY